MTCQIDGAWDGDSAEIYSEVMRKARKPHKCCECGEPISPGERYQEVSGKWDGDFFSYHTCALCSEIRKSLFCSWVFTQMWKELAEHNVFSVSLKNLSMPAIEKVEAFWGKYK